MSVTAAEFEAAYAARSGVTVAELRAAGRVVVRCRCGEESCQGWASVSAAVAANWDETAGRERLG